QALESNREGFGGGCAPTAECSRGNYKREARRLTPSSRGELTGQLRGRRRDVGDYEDVPLPRHLRSSGITKNVSANNIPRWEAEKHRLLDSKAGRRVDTLLSGGAGMTIGRCGSPNSCVGDARPGKGSRAPTCVRPSRFCSGSPATLRQPVRSA